MPTNIQFSDILIEVGDKTARPFLGYGWSGQEGDRLQDFQWISHLEADVWVDLPPGAAFDLWVSAAPYYLNWRKQTIGLYVNDCFIGEVVCPDNPACHDYHFSVASNHVDPGRNRLTLRMAYRYRRAGDPREFSLAVDKILVRPR